MVYMSKKKQAYLIIGAFASLAAAWSAATAIIPVAGPLLADTPGLTILTMAMAYSLSLLYKRDMSSASLAAFASVAVGFIAGNLILKMAVSLLPIWGSAVNASITAVLHTAIGLTLVDIFESGRTIDDYSREELTDYFKKNKDRAENERKKYEAAFNQLPPDAKKEIMELQIRMKQKNLPISEVNVIANRITEIFTENGVDYLFED